MQVSEITRRPELQVEFAENAERLALRLALLFSLLQLLSVVLFYARSDGAPLVGGLNSVAAHALLSSLLIALIASPLAYLRGLDFRYTSHVDTQHGQHRWSAVPVTVGATLLVGLLVAVGFEIISRSFVDIRLDLASVAIILTILTGALTYLVVRPMMLARTSALLVYLAVFYLFATLLLSTYGQDNPMWWQRSFSYLGMDASNTRLIFDLGLVLTGILVVTWQYFFMDDFALLEARNLLGTRGSRIVRMVLIIAGVLLAFVGIFRYGISPFFNVVHDMSATGMGVLIGLLMISLHWVVLGYQRIFYFVSAVMAFLIVMAAILKVAGFYSLVGSRTVSFT